MLARKALAGTAGAPKLYVEDVMSCFLYTGNNNTAQTITNNIDLSTEGGLIWFKDRSNVNGHFLIDTVRGANSQLRTHSTAAETTSTNYISSFNNNGFTLGTNGNINGSETQVSWTFRKAKKFFDVVTYTGNGTAGRTVSHNLGSTPGCIIVKDTGTAGTAWAVYHRSNGNTKYMWLHDTSAVGTSSGYWNDTDPTSTVFTLGTNSNVNGNGKTYVAYLFAHDAGGFGDAGSDSIIKCGSYTNNSSAPVSVNLGWEPQWILIKVTSGTTGGWQIVDNMRGISYSATKPLEANSSVAEGNEPELVTPTATGFDIKNNVSANFNSAATTGTVSYIYIAIRRGPMKTPTSGTSVYSAVAYTGNGTNQTLSPGFVTDLAFFKGRNESTYGTRWYDRLRGPSLTLISSSTTSESDDGYVTMGFMNGFKVSTFADSINGSSYTYVTQMFRRAPGFFDVVCYTGTGSNRTVSHNLGVAPELLITKGRTSVGSSLLWLVYSSSLGNNKYLRLEQQNGSTNDSSGLLWNLTSPTSSVFSLGTGATNESGANYVAYLFASVSGVSKVGSYTGNGSSVTVTTDFQPRFILVKRTDSTGDWIVSDSARGLVSGSDPYLLLNSTAAEDTDEDWVDVSSTGFTVNQTTAANANVNTGTYIYLCIA